MWSFLKLVLLVATAPVWLPIVLLAGVFMAAATFAIGLIATGLFMVMFLEFLNYINRL